LNIYCLNSHLNLDLQGENCHYSAENTSDTSRLVFKAASQSAGNSACL